MKYYYKILVSIAVALMFLTSLVKAMNVEPYRFRTFSPEGGFYYDGVMSIQQDGEGFIWVLMRKNLYRFDGYQHKQYFSSFRDLKPDKEWIFRNLSADSRGNLYVSTNNGLYAYSRLQDSFEKVLDEDILLSIVDQHDMIWVNKSDTFYLFNSQKGSLVPFYCKNEPVVRVRSVDAKDGKLYISSYSNKIYRYDYEHSDFDLLHSYPAAFEIMEIRVDKGNIWAFVRDQGLFKIDIATGEIREKFDSFLKSPVANPTLRTFHIDKNGLIWIATQTGLYTLDPATGEYRLYTHDENNLFCLTNNSVWSIAEDKHRNLLFGTYSGGLCYVNLDEKDVFETHQGINDQRHSLISSFAENDRYVWIGTEGGGLARMDKRTKELTPVLHEPGGRALHSNNIKSILLEDNDKLWIATYRGGLSCYDMSRNRLKHFNRTNDEKGLLANDLRKIVLDGDSGIWIAYQTPRCAVSFYSFRNQTFTHYVFDEGRSFIFDICKDNKSLWIITQTNLYEMRLDDRRFKNVQLNDSVNLNAQSIYADGKNNVWIGTIGNGLIRYNVKTATFTSYNEFMKHNVFSIFSICQDEGEYLWLGTDNGLIRYDIARNSFHSYNREDGIQGEVFYPLAALKGKSGELYIGGTKGFTIVRPNKLSSNMQKPEVIVSDFYIDNKPVRVDIQYRPVKDASPARYLELNYREVNFGFTFSSTNYVLPGKNRFKYRLKNYDDRWIETDAFNRTVFYSQVPPGHYVFEVCAANNDGLWNTEPLQINILRLPAPWFSWPMYAVYTLLLLVVAYVIFNYYRKQQKMKMEIYMNRLEKEKKEEIHQSQLRFFTNISHEFKTPLALILAAVDKLRQEGLKEYYYKILNSNSRRLLNLVNDLMDFRAIENKKMEIKVQSSNLNHFIEKVAADFEDYAVQKNINYSILTDEKLPSSVPFDKDMMEKIVMNLLMNSFKYTRPGGMISIRTYGDASDFKSKYSYSYTIKGDDYVLSEDTFSIVVSDSGVGISPESIATVFERFFKLNTVNQESHLGSGIGLALVRSLVLLHKGSISIYSERDKGTDICVTFSLSPSVYSEENLCDGEEEETAFSLDDAMCRTGDELPAGAEEDPEDATQRTKKRILLAEDNDDLRHFIAEGLSEEYKVLEAADGEKASLLLEKVHVDMIISDIMMPHKDGITLCREVKNDVDTSHIPFILITSKSGLESHREGLDSKADFYIEKPLEMDLLLAQLQNIFQRQQALKEYYSKNYFVDGAELSSNEQDNRFLKRLMGILDKKLGQADMDVNSIASELAMSRSKLYGKVKMLTDKSIVEFILNYKLRRAAQMMISENLPIREVAYRIGLESQSYFSRVFKKEFGETPTSFLAKYKKKKPDVDTREFTPK